MSDETKNEKHPGAWIYDYVFPDEGMLPPLKMQAMRDLIDYVATKDAEIERLKRKQSWFETYSALERERDELKAAARAAYLHLDKYGVVDGPDRELSSQENVFGLLRPLVGAVPVEAEERKETKRVKQVLLFRNSMVAAFDYDGQQIPELQGPKAEVFRKLMDAVDVDTEFRGFDAQ